MKVNSKLSILFWLRNQQSKNGNKDLYARLTIEGARAEVSLGIKVPSEHWDQELGKLTDDSPQSSLINRRIDEAKVKLQRLYDVLETQHSIVEPEMLKNAFTGKKDKKKKFSLLEATNFVIEKFVQKVEKNLRARASLVKWETTRKKIKAFLNHQFKTEDIPLTKITFSFAEDFYDYLTLEEGVTSNTAYKYIKNTKHILRKSVQRNWITTSPIEDYPCSYVHPERDILDEKQLVYLYHKNFDNERLQEVKDCYLFMCFTGYAFKDAELLRPEDVVQFFDGEDWIIKNREKTLCRENVPLLPIAKEIIERYREHPYCKEHNRLIPIKSNQKFNAYLKEVADLCGIKKVLTTHTARHTFATTVTLSNGVPIETVSALLGHKSIKTTQIYAKIVASKISKDMKQLKKQLQLKMPQSLIKTPIAA